MQNIIKKSQFVSTPVIVLPNDTDPEEQKYKAWQTLRDSGMTAADVGKLFGVGISTVYNHTVGTYDYSEKRVTAMNAANRRNYEERKEYYAPLMLELRELGYSNADIARKTGFCAMTVWRYIGSQPDETTLASMRVAGAKRHFRCVARKNQPERDAGKPIPAVAKILNPEVA